MRTVGIIGAGRIGGPVIRWLAETADHAVGAVLVRTSRSGAMTDPSEFFAQRFDLVLDLAGPQALTAHGARALAAADVWTIGGAALADPALFASLEQAGQRHGHRLRVMGGALDALGGIGAVAAAGGGLDLRAARPGSGVRAEGSVRQMARAHPDETSFAVAAALAGLGLDATRMALDDPGPGGAHRLGAVATGAFGRLETCVTLDAQDGLHPVAAAVIAALKADARVIWAG